MSASVPSLIEFRFSNTAALLLNIQPGPVQGILDDLKRRLKGSGGVYSLEPTLLNFSSWPEEELQTLDQLLAPLVQLLKKFGLNPVHCIAPFEALEGPCQQLGLRHALVAEVHHAQSPAESTAEVDSSPTQSPTHSATHSSTAQADTAQAAQAPVTDAAAPNANAGVPTLPNGSRTTLTIDHPVRSGQRIYAQGSDLVVMGQVSAGAEVIADGHVHVYGTLRGRALAGASGDTTARIHSTCFEPELVSVAGYYLTFEGGYPDKIKGNPTLVYLEQTDTSNEVRLKPIHVR